MKDEIQQCNDIHYAKSMASECGSEKKQWEARIAQLGLPRTGDVGYSNSEKLWFLVVVDDAYVKQYYQPNKASHKSDYGIEYSSASLSRSIPCSSPDVAKIKEEVVYNLFDRFGVADKSK